MTPPRPAGRYPSAGKPGRYDQAHRPGPRADRRPAHPLGRLPV